MAEIKFGGVKIATGKLAGVFPTPQGVRISYELQGRPPAVVVLDEAEALAHVAKIQEALAARARLKGGD